MGIAILGVALVAGCLYLPIVHHPFIGFDDPDYITENSHVKEGLTWRTILWAWTSLEHGNWHPATWISHAADVQVFGLDPAGHHLTSLLLHSANAALLFLVLAVSTRRPGCSLSVALFFAVHPLNVESVAWVAERKSLLSAFWSLLALLTYIRYVRSTKLTWLAATTGLFFIALASKPMAITLPFLLVVLDRWPLERVNAWQELFTLRKLWTEKIVLFALSVFSAVITIIAQHRSGAITSITQVSLASRLVNAIISDGFYAWKLIWPFKLAFLYPWPQHGPPLVELAGALLFLFGATVLAWNQRQSRPWLMVGWFWFLGTLVPVIGIVQVGSQSRADRYAYIPMIGLLVAGVWSGAEAMRVSSTARLRLASVTVLAIAVFLAAATRTQINVWRSEHELWLHAWQVTADNYLAADKVGMALQKQGRYQDALLYFRQALQINSADPLANFNIGADLHLQGKVLEAVRHYQLTAGQDTSAALRADAFENMGVAYLQLGDLQVARESYLKALQYDPGRTRIYAALQEIENRAKTR
ncbi:MAG: tetratricopeptide repeat protein [Candidatus Sulfotelmatobacter sp.]